MLTEHADAIGRQVAEAETALGDLLAGRTGRLWVRYFATAGAHLVAPAVALGAENPGVQIDLKLTGPEPLPDVQEGRADLALVVGPSDRDEGVRLLHLLDDPYLAVLPRRHPLAARRIDPPDRPGRRTLGRQRVARPLPEAQLTPVPRQGSSRASSWTARTTPRHRASWRRGSG